MAASPVYMVTAKIAHCRITTGVTATDGSGSSTALTWYNTAPNADYMWVKAIVSSTSGTGVGDLADSLIHVFVDDGTTARLVRSVDAGNPSAGSTTATGYQLEINFGPDWVFPSSVLPEFSVSASPTAGNVDIVFIAQMV